MTARKSTRPAVSEQLAADLAPARYVVQPGHAITPLGGAQRAAGAVVTVADVGAAALPALMALGALAPEQPDEE